MGCLANFTLCFSQQIIVLDSITKRPIPYVTVNTGNNTGLYSNEHGTFLIGLNDFTSLELSHVGYKTLYVQRGKVNDTLFMLPKTKVLQEILIKKNNTPDLILKAEKRAKNFSSLALIPQTELLTVIFPDKKIVNATIKDVVFTFANNIEKRDEYETYSKINAVVRINVYDVEVNHPNIRVFSSLPFKISSYLEDKITLNLSENDIKITEKGLCFGVEMIGYSKETDLVEVKSAFIRPGLTDKQNKFFSSRTFLKYTFDDTSKILPVKELLMRGMSGGKEIDRNLILGMTVVPQ